MKIMGKDTIIKQMNALGSSRTPFIFIIDFLMKHPKVFLLEEMDENTVLFNFNGFANIDDIPTSEKFLMFKKHAVEYEEYTAVFNKVKKELNYGNSYLLNLTFETPIETNFTQEELFYSSDAKYKMLWKNQFVVFSPEIFVRINENGIISSYPMKGTIDAAIENAESKLKSDAKEFAEHCTIVDLIRNDLSRVAKKVRVKRFGYADYLKTHDKTLIQLSSEIEGELPKNFNEHLGDILFELLPAGSISGAPKMKTLEIICNHETHSRGFYTGVMGYFDGKTIDSSVMIRFIDFSGAKPMYKSGGGITISSQCDKEYQEMIDKVYVPII